jgi:probable HAF family extracellular repeat protein
MTPRFGARACRFVVASTLAFLAASPVDAGGIYGLTALPQGAYGIDNAGQVLTSGGLYQDGVTTPITLPGTNQTISPVAISPGGTLAYNQGYTGYGATERAYVLKDGKSYNAGTASDGPLTGSDSYSIAHAINDAGAVAGESRAYGRWDRAFTSAPGPDGTYQPVSMGANGGSISGATAINNLGTVVGWSDVATQWKNHAFVGTPSNDIGTLGGQDSKATAINDRGQVVGWSNIATDWMVPANNQSYYTPEPNHAFLYQDGKMHDLGTLPGFQDSVATAINAQGQIVGYVGNAQADSYDGSLMHAALFDSGTGKVTDLNGFLPTGSGWVLNDATGINDSGQIIGYGTLNGVGEGFLLTPSTGDIAPVPEPGTLAVAAFGIAIVGWRRRSK